ncbi:MAG: hypothetical protein RMJ39_11115, partial [Deltaproteobacteria bacterium]|nr:hypothetical protein [Deltaproteobacteria bacterium]
FLSLWIEECMHIYLKPFEVLGFINGIREICREAESKPKTKSRVVIENFDINLPNTCMYVGTVNFTFWYWKPKKLIMDLYDLPINDNFVVWVFKEIEKEFSLFLEAYEEERRRVSIPHR